MSTITIVNDEPSILQFLKMALGNAGYDVRGYARGAEALKAFATTRSDLVITDKTNSPMDGIEFVRGLRREWPNVRIVFASAWALDLQTELRGTGLAADCYIQLPCSLEDLKTAVRLVLEARRRA